MDAQNQDVLSAFNQLFTPVVQFPRWYQPHPEIGAILVQNEEEENELKARDWSPKPLPGSESPVTKISSVADVADALEVLQQERDLLEQEKVTFRAEMDARMARLEAMLGGAGQAPGTPPAGSSSGSDTPPAGDIVGGLSDASSDVDEAPPPAPAPKKSK